MHDWKLMVLTNLISNIVFVPGHHTSSLTQTSFCHFYTLFLTRNSIGISFLFPRNFISCSFFSMFAFHITKSTNHSAKFYYCWRCCQKWALTHKNIVWPSKRYKKKYFHHVKNIQKNEKSDRKKETGRKSGKKIPIENIIEMYCWNKWLL